MFNTYFPSAEAGSTLSVVLQRAGGAVLGNDTQDFTFGLVEWCVSNSQNTFMQESDVEAYYTVILSPMPALADMFVSTNGQATLILLNYYGLDDWMDSNIGSLLSNSVRCERSYCDMFDRSTLEWDRVSYALGCM